jgi:nicotinamidase/pyrazinamidase
MATPTAVVASDVLVVVDVQHDFCPGGRLAVPDGDAVIDPINRLAQLFANVVLTQDWHPAGHLSFASSQTGRAPFESISIPK